MNWLHKYGFAVICVCLLLLVYVTHSNQAVFYTINAWHVYLPNEAWLAINMLSYSKFFILPGLKHLLSHPRPYISLDHHAFFWLNRFEDAVGSAHSSFPSGHAGNMAVFVFSLYHLFFEKKPWPQLFLVLLLLLTMVARICTGWHWPMDVLASVAIGFVLVQWCFSFSVRRR
jgi:membrane-associated phospholipid phosphatase